MTIICRVRSFRVFLMRMYSFRLNLHFLLIASLFSLPAFADVLVFQSGKIIHGQLLWEESDSVRFRDDTGITMTVKKSLLNQEATREANKAEVRKPSPSPVKQQPKATTLAEVARQNLEARKASQKVFTNSDVSFGPTPSASERKGPAVDLTSASERDMNRRVQLAESLFNRLKEQCRAAGGEGSPVHGIVTYLVGGKQVTVSGNFANPTVVKHAKRLCQQALIAQNDLAQARKDFADWQSLHSSTD